MSIQANVTNQQITASVGETKIDVSVSGGVGPSGPAGPAGGGYTLPTATESVLGGVRIGSGISIDGNGVISASSGYTLPTATASVLGGVTFGVTAGTACQGNDARLTDAREWSASTVSQADAEAGSSTSRFAFTPLRVFQAIAAWWAGSAAKTKLDGIASGATANATDAQLLSRANHTGTQLASTISDFTTAVIAAAPPTTNASLLTSGTLAAARIGTHTHAAADIVSGVIATARLGTGSPSASNFLRGDGEFAAAPVTSVNGKTGDVLPGTVFEFTRSSAPADATGSGGSWAWTPPANCTMLEILCIGAGGGGGSGRRGAAGSARFGGGGGSGGNVSHISVPRSLITSPLQFTIAAGGAGGAAVTADDTNGNAGSPPSQNTQVNMSSTLVALGVAGSGGGAGTPSAGTGASASANSNRTYSGGAGGASSISANAGNSGVGPGICPFGGAGGGGLSASNVAYAGGSAFSFGGGYYYQLGTTGSGGSASTTADAAAGAAGRCYGFGGSGGGASANGFNSGAGGNGGDGYVRITVW